MSGKRRTNWRRTLGVVTPLTFICGIVAVVYFFYRAALIAVPAVSFEQHLFHPVGSPSIVCGGEEGSNLKDPEPFVSAKYQSYIQSQTATTNLVVNPSLTSLDPVSGLPTGYSQNTDNATSKFEYLQDATDKQLFLRASNDATDKNTQAPSWLTDPVRIEDDHTYAYSFSYRSNIPVRIDVEQIKSNKPAYRHIMTLKPTATWQSFTAHLNNADDAEAFRVVLAGTGRGYVDSRNFDIHQIPDAHLSTGTVTVAFDDGWESVEKNALPLLEKYNIRTTQYIISDVSRQNVQEYMNIETVAKLKRAGHEIGSHSLTHCNQTELTESQLADNAVRSKMILEQSNLGPIRSFAYPLGQYNEKTQAVYGQQYPLIRTSDFGYNDRYFDDSNIHSIGVLSSTSDREFRSWLDHAKTHRLWLVLVYHRINESGTYNVTDEQLERQLKMITTSGLKTLPLAEAADDVRR